MPRKATVEPFRQASQRVSAFVEARRCWAEINLAALLHNLAAVRAQVGSGIAIMGVVKANAYGHGVGPVAHALEGKVEMLAVANLAEARELRRHAPTTTVYILGPALPEEREEIARSGFIPAVSTLEEAAAYNTWARDQPAQIHLTIDSGMGRIGVWQEDALELAFRIAKLPNLRVTGIATHLPVSDEDDRFTAEQLRRFTGQAAKLREALGAGALRHSHNSAGVIGFAEQAGEMVRAGLMLYGSAPRAEFQSRLRAVMTWKTRVTLVRDFEAGRGISYGRTFITQRPTRVATLAVGYADGYQRHLSGSGAEVLIRGRRCPVLGRVTMDQIMVDVTALGDVQVGEEVVLLGRQGDDEIPAGELATKAGTIPWEIFTGISSRVERTYISDS